MTTTCDYAGCTEDAKTAQIFPGDDTSIKVDLCTKHRGLLSRYVKLLREGQAL